MVPEISQFIEAHKSEMVSTLQEVLRIRSVNDVPEKGAPYGRGCKEVLDKALEICESMGFHTVNVDGQCGYAEYGEGDEVIGIFSHLDVVEEGAGWTYPPFEAQIHDGEIWGRGALDNKGPGIASLYGLLAIKELGLPVRRRIRMVFGIDEESGMRDMQYYVEKCGAPFSGFSPDAQFPVSFAERPNSQVYVAKKIEQPCCETPRLITMTGGTITGNIPDHCTASVLSEDEKTTEEILEKLNRFTEKTGWRISAAVEQTPDSSQVIMFTSLGVTGHPYTPRLAQNAVSQLMMFLDRIGLKGETGAIIHLFKEKIGMEYFGESMGLDHEDVSGWLTFSNTYFHLNDEDFYAVFKMYRPYYYPLEEIVTQIERALSSQNIKVVKSRTSPGVMRDKNSPLIRKLSQIYGEHTGLDSTPRSVGGTYAKVVPNICGFGAIFPWGYDYCHVVNERMAVSDLVLMSKIYGDAIYELATMDFHDE